MSGTTIVRKNVRILEYLDMVSAQHGCKVYKHKHLKAGRLFRISPDDTEDDPRFCELRAAFPQHMRGARSGDGFGGGEGFIVCSYQTVYGEFVVFAAHIAYKEGLLSVVQSKAADGEDEDFIQSVYNPAVGGGAQFMVLMGLTLRTCACCKKPLEKSYKCAACREAGLHARYCGRACQAAHWPVHRRGCGGRWRE